MRKSPLRVAVLALALLAITVGIAACGSSSSSNSSSNSAASESSTSTSQSAASSGGSKEAFVSSTAAAALKEVTGEEALTAPATEAELTERVAKYTAVPSHLLQATPIAKKATSGKTLDLLVCGVPVCAEFNNAASQAASLLGWKIQKISLGVSPQEFSNAYNQAVQNKPDMVIGSGLPRTLFNTQLTELEKMNIPVIEWSSGITPVPGHLWVAADNPLYEASGMMLAEFVAADSKLKGEMVTYSVAQYPMTQIMVHTLQEYGPKICSGCKFTLEEVPVTDIGKLGPVVTGYIQQHPGTKYVFCGFGDLCQGVGEALKAAGLSSVKVLTRDSSTTDFENIKNGLEWAAMPLPIYQTGWQIIDLAQRIFNKESTEGTRLSPIQIVTSVSNPSSKTIGAAPNFEEQYKQLWKIG